MSTYGEALRDALAKGHIMEDELLPYEIELVKGFSEGPPQGPTAVPNQLFADQGGLDRHTGGRGGTANLGSIIGGQGLEELFRVDESEGYNKFNIIDRARNAVAPLANYAGQYLGRKIGEGAQHVSISPKMTDFAFGVGEGSGGNDLSRLMGMGDAVDAARNFVDPTSGAAITGEIAGILPAFAASEALVINAGLKAFQGVKAVKKGVDIYNAVDRTKKLTRVGMGVADLTGKFARGAAIGATFGTGMEALRSAAYNEDFDIRNPEHEALWMGGFDAAFGALGQAGKAIRSAWKSHGKAGVQKLWRQMRPKASSKDAITMDRILETIPDGYMPPESAGQLQNLGPQGRVRPDDVLPEGPTLETMLGGGRGPAQPVPTLGDGFAPVKSARESAETFNQFHGDLTSNATRIKNLEHFGNLEKKAQQLSAEGAQIKNVADVVPKIEPTVPVQTTKQIPVHEALGVPKPVEGPLPKKIPKTPKKGPKVSDIAEQLGKGGPSTKVKRMSVAKILAGGGLGASAVALSKLPDDDKSDALTTALMLPLAATPAGRRAIKKTLSKYVGKKVTSELAPMLKSVVTKLKEGGGGTFSFKKGLREFDGDGYMVEFVGAKPFDKSKLTEKKILDVINGKDLQKMAERLENPQLGGWVDDATGKVHLGVTGVFPHNKEGKLSAELAGGWFNQKAIGEVSRGKYVRDVNLKDASSGISTRFSEKKLEKLEEGFSHFNDNTVNKMKSMIKKETSLAGEWVDVDYKKIKSIFGDKADEASDILAILSAQKNMELNVQQGWKALVSLVENKGKVVEGIMDGNQAKKIEALWAGKNPWLDKDGLYDEFAQRKIQNFARMIKGDKDAVVADVHMKRIFFGKKGERGLYKPSKAQLKKGETGGDKVNEQEYNFIETFVRDMAKDLDMKAGEAQAALWAAWKKANPSFKENVFMGSSPTSYAPRLLEDIRHQTDEVLQYFADRGGKLAKKTLAGRLPEGKLKYPPPNKKVKTTNGHQMTPYTRQKMVHYSDEARDYIDPMFQGTAYAGEEALRSGDKNFVKGSWQYLLKEGDNVTKEKFIKSKFAPDRNVRGQVKHFSAPKVALYDLIADPMKLMAKYGDDMSKLQTVLYRNRWSGIQNSETGIAYVFDTVVPRAATKGSKRIYSVAAPAGFGNTVAAFSDLDDDGKDKLRVGFNLGTLALAVGVFAGKGGRRKAVKPVSKIFERPAKKAVQKLKGVADDLSKKTDDVIKKVDDVVEPVAKKTDDLIAVGTTKEAKRLMKEFGPEGVELGAHEVQKVATVMNVVKSNRMVEQADDIAKEVLNTGRMANTKEMVAMGMRTRDLVNEEKVLMKEIDVAIAAGDDVTARKLMSQLNSKREQMEQLVLAGKHAEREAGRVVNITQYMVNRHSDEYADVLIRARAAKGSPLVEKQRKFIENISDELAREKKAYDALLVKHNRMSEKTAKVLANKQVKIQKVLEKSNVARTKLKQERADILAEFKKTFSANMMLTPEQLYLGGRLAMNFAKEGGHTLDDIVKLMQAEIPDLTARDVYDAILSKNPNVQRRARTEALKNVTLLKNHAKTMQSIEKFADELGSLNSRDRGFAKELHKTLAKMRKEAYDTTIDADKLSRGLETLNELQDQVINYRKLLKAKNKVDADPVLKSIRDKIKVLKRKMKVDDELKSLDKQIKENDFIIPQKRVRNIPPELERSEVELMRLRKVRDNGIRDMAPKSVGDVLGDVASAPRSAMTTADMSTWLRQNVIPALSHPIKTIKHFPKSIKATFSEFNAARIHNSLLKGENGHFYEKHGLKLRELDGSVSAREESFSSKLIERLPVLGSIVRASNRNMVTVGNLIRTGLFDDFLRANPNAPKEILDAYADWLNVTTGIGNLGRFEGAASKLAGVFFAPKLAVSRIQAPWMLVRDYLPSKIGKFKAAGTRGTLGNSKALRKAKARDMLGFVATGTTMLGLASLWTDVELNPESPDWGKIKIGNTRYDIWGGFQQPARLIARILQGAGSSLDLWKSKAIDPVDLTMRFLSYKLSPWVNTTATLIRGKDAVGQKTSPSEAIYRSILPLVYQDIQDAYDDGGFDNAAIAGAAAFFGVGVSTYKSRKGKRKAKRRTKR